MARVRTRIQTFKELESKMKPRDRDVEDSSRPNNPALRKGGEEALQDHQQALLDEALEESFPASDPAADLTSR